MLPKTLQGCSLQQHARHGQDHFAEELTMRHLYAVCGLLWRGFLSRSTPGKYLDALGNDPDCPDLRGRKFLPKGSDRMHTTAGAVPGGSCWVGVRSSKHPVETWHSQRPNVPGGLEAAMHAKNTRKPPMS